MPKPYFTNFAQVDAHLESLGLFRMCPGLERMQVALERLGLARPPFTVVQVVGTNGKGSTSTMLAALGLSHGLTTGLHTSPHFVSVRERIRINGRMLPEAEWTALASHLMAHGGEALSYFEFVTCLALLAFAANNVHLAVMETGLGGRYDATTAIEADLVVFTPVSLDHQNILGVSLVEIAADKAGAIRSQKQVLSAPQVPEVAALLAAAAKDSNAPYTALDKKGPPLLAPPPCSTVPPVAVPQEGAPSLSMQLRGPHQLENARLALAAWRIALSGSGFGEKLPATALALTAPLSVQEARGLAQAWLPGRLQYVPPKREAVHGFTPCSAGWPPMVLDGAHNGHGLAALGLALGRAGVAPLAVVFSCLVDKEPEQLIPHLRSLATGKIFVPPIADNPRAMAPKDIAALIGLNAEPADSFQDALQKASEHMLARMPEAFAEREGYPLLVCGSLYMLGELYALRPDCLEAPGAEAPDTERL